MRNPEDIDDDEDDGYDDDWDYNPNQHQPPDGCANLVNGLAAFFFFLLAALLVFIAFQALRPFD
jgi:hypothetical protein